ncbi:SusD family protein [Reichenbachiella agariperforans]|uniref:SusD family protein n=1 Tax=Reichenbachiella agariperforans TaxID=156994 RepID=A0A1M6R7G1_REIAG|nr:RagB/SusD family nutrient uptake outer membrane protein [Reichenbachiella agariperforans]SHK28392.1 SusD family protein [Reichenbachiella agariperforans]
MKRIAQIILIFSVMLSACENYLDIEPIGQVIPKSVDEFRSFLTAAYDTEIQHKVVTTYRTDELLLESNRERFDFYKDIYVWNDVNPGLDTRVFPYATFYTIIFYTNHVIGSADDITGDSEEIDQLVGEAHALRALQYFDLVNLYAKPYDAATAASDEGVPVTTEYDAKRDYPRAPVSEVYKLIISDIEQAEGLLNVEQQPEGYNYRFSVLAIKSLKARVYLYQKEWQKAVDAAQEAMAIKSDLMDLNQAQTVMASEYNSVESILALNTVTSFDMIEYASVSPELIAQYDQTTDLRYANYFTLNSDNKYKSNKTSADNFKCTLRTSDLYLIIAEASAHLGGASLTQSREALYALTQNRYTPDGWEDYKLRVGSLDQMGLTDEILSERQREFALEGQRWNDLRRTTQQRIDKTLDGETYVLEQNDERYVIPFPQDAIINNPDLQSN